MSSRYLKSRWKWNKKDFPLYNEAPHCNSKSNFCWNQVISLLRLSYLEVSRFGQGQEEKKSGLEEEYHYVRSNLEKAVRRSSRNCASMSIQSCGNLPTGLQWIRYKELANEKTELVLISIRKKYNTVNVRVGDHGVVFQEVFRLYAKRIRRIMPYLPAKI